MSAIPLPKAFGRPVFRCECGLIQFPTKDGKCRKSSCRLPFANPEPDPAPEIAIDNSPIPWNGCKVAHVLPDVVTVLRMAHRMTQKQLGDKLGVPRTWVSKVENLKATPTLRSLVSLVARQSCE